MLLGFKVEIYKIKKLKKQQVDADVYYLVLGEKTLYLIFLILRINFQNKGTKLMK